MVTSFDSSGRIHGTDRDVFQVSFHDDILPTTDTSYWQWDGTGNSFVHYDADGNVIPLAPDGPIITGNDRVLLDGALDASGDLPSLIDFAGGVDIYEIYNALAADVTISDSFATDSNRNLIVFDDDVEFDSFVINDAGLAGIVSLELTLNNADSSVVILNAPVGSFEYQVGSIGPIFAYEDFIDYLEIYVV